VAEHTGEVDARIIMHHLDEYLAEDGPAKLAGFISQLGRPVGLKLLQSINDAFEEYGQPGASGYPFFNGILEVLQAIPAHG
jgi:hypothetical protein